jgi:beta-lactamase class A
MLRVMSMPGRDRIFWGTEVPNGTLVYNKTGTTAHLCGDMGILVTKTKSGQRVPYAIVGIVERPSTPKDYRQWMVKGGGVIRDFSSLVYSEMKRKYNLL